MKTGWQHAHEIVEQIRTTNLSKDGLTRGLGVVLGMLTEGPNVPGNVEKGAKLMLALRQPNGVKDFLAEMKKVDNVKLQQIPDQSVLYAKAKPEPDPCRGQTCESCVYPIDGCC